MTYDLFLNGKRTVDIPTGITIKKKKLNPLLLDFQHDLVYWALRRGRAALFCDCGLGKSFMQLEWAYHVPGEVLIVAPLAVGPQTVKEAIKFGIPDVSFNQTGDKQGKITITNYENLHKFSPDDFNGIVLDESSILKNETGAFRNDLIETWGSIPFRLACTATPSPNDLMELGNHSQFLGVMTFTEMLATYFVHDGGETQKWRLKGHASKEFWNWVSQWAVMMRDPKELGYKVSGFDLPALDIHHIEVETENKGPYLFQMAAETLQERIQARRDTIDERAKQCAELILSKGGTWVVWCNLNAEAEALRKLLPDAVEVKGSDKPSLKVERLGAFSDGTIQILITKPKIAAMGMNWQHCNQVAFLGLSDSFEQYYQAVRRCWRFGQKNTVNAYIIAADQEGNIVENIKRKELQHEGMIKDMAQNMIEYTKSELNSTSKQTDIYKTNSVEGKNFTAYLGDCVDVVASLPDESVHYSIFSPPFASLYTYSNSDRDMGNCRSHDEFYQHFQFLVEDLHRVLKAGRLVSFHCMNLPTSKQNHGYIGIRDFRGELIRIFENAGFVFHSEVVIWKDPVVAMQRTKAIGLLHKQLKKDSALSRQGIPDYLVTMRKLGVNDEPVSHTNETFPVQLWQKYASPVWMDINPSDTLQYRSAREHNDERHICPLQLQVIERGIDLWTNPDDVVLSPFMGIGSEGHVSLMKGRRFIGAELKESYYKQAVANLKHAEDAAVDGVIPGLTELISSV